MIEHLQLFDQSKKAVALAHVLKVVVLYSVKIDASDVFAESNIWNIVVKKCVFYV